MNIRVIEDINDPFLQSEWERLEREADVFPQSSYHWCATWWKHLAGRRKLHVVMVLDEEGKALAIAPLCIERNLGIRALRSFPVNYCDFFQIITSPKTDRDRLFESLLDHCTRYDRWHAVLLTPVNDCSSLFEFLRSKGMAEKHLIGNVVADISAAKWEKYLATLSRNRRRLTKKKMQALETDHKVEVEFITDEPRYAEHFDRIREIQQLRATKDRAGRSPVYLQCVRETNGRLFADGQMVLYLIKADGIVISYRIGILKGKTYYDWNTNYDIAYSDYSPGLISLAYVIRDLIGRGFTTLDFMAGVYDYKLSYSPKHQMRNNYLFVMGSRSIRSSLYCKYQLGWRDRLKACYQRLIKVISNVRRVVRQRWELLVNRLCGVRDRVRQYGLLPAVAQLVQAAFRCVYEVNRDIVFVIPVFKGHEFADPCVIPMTRQRIEQAVADGELDEKQAKLLNGFIEEGSRGLCAEVNGQLAGYAWVQLAGEYQFGRTGLLNIPPGYAFVKNLLVRPEFRGQKLGQKLNAARLALIPAGVTPVVFIIPENRYAIRNWETYGFERIVEAKRWQWFGRGKWRMRLTKLSDCTEADSLMKAIEESNHA